MKTRWPLSLTWGVSFDQLPLLIWCTHLVGQCVLQFLLRELWSAFWPWFLKEECYGSRCAHKLTIIVKSIQFAFSGKSSFESIKSWIWSVVSLIIKSRRSKILVCSFFIIIRPFLKTYLKRSKHINKKNRIKIIRFLKSSFSQCLNLMTLMLLIKQIVLIIAM